MKLHLGSDAATKEIYELASKRLTTHGVVFGMTGSGKTGLCVDLLEEAALAGIPILAIDPKGDLASLGQMWPEERAEDWTKGLAESGVDAARIEALRTQVDVTVHTPGSSACNPIDVLGAFDAPAGASEEDQAEAATTAACAVLGLAGIHGDPVRDPRLLVAIHVILHAWAAGETLTAEQLVLRMVDPPFAKVGVFPVDTFLPRAKRMDVAMALNGVLASPSFAAWMQGPPLDIDALLAPVDGRTPVRVMYLAHLDDAARSFFVTLLLSKVLAWSRQQSGSDDLRALLFFDEVYGFLPPHPKAPPAKRPLLTLMKQARAVGLGVVLCTQNPVDLDYKALSNAGWWAVGRLSTAQDRDRVLDGMTAVGVDRSALSKAIGGLAPWSFAVRDVREQAVRTIRSRWAISYLGGPITLGELSARTPDTVVAPPTPAPPPVEAPRSDPPTVPKGLEVRWLRDGQRFTPAMVDAFGDGERPTMGPNYVPAVYVRAALRFDERGFAHDRTAHRLYFPVGRGGEPREVELPDAALVDRSPGPSSYAQLPDDLDEAAEVKRMKKAVVDALFDGETTALFSHAPTKLKSAGGEARDAFEVRVAEAVQDAIDARVAKLRTKVEATVKRLEDKRKKAERSIETHKADAQARLATEVVNVGETLFGMIFGGRSRSLTTAMSKRQATSKANAKATQAASDLRDLEHELYEAEVSLGDEIKVITNEELATRGDIERLDVRLERSDIRVSDMWLVWVPMHRPV